MVTHYVGAPGVTVNIEHPMDVLDALDAIHTQVLDNLSEAEMVPYVEVLERAIERLRAIEETRCIVRF